MTTTQCHICGVDAAESIHRDEAPVRFYCDACAGCHGVPVEERCDHCFEIAHTLTLDIIALNMRATDCPGDDCDTCGACMWGMAWDALASMPAHVAVTRDTVFPAFGEPFGRLTASRNGEEIATVTRFWDIAEGLWDLLARVEERVAPC